MEPSPRIPISLIQDLTDKQGNKSLRGFYEYLYDHVTKDEKTALKFATKHKLISPQVTCKFCKIRMSPEKQISSDKTPSTLQLRCPGSCKRRRSVTVGTVFQTTSSHLPLSTVFKILGFWATGYSLQLTTKLVSVNPLYVKYWYTVISDVCRRKLLQHGVSCSDYTIREVEVTWRHIFGTCITDQQCQTHWVRLISHMADIRPPCSVI